MLNLLLSLREYKKLKADNGINLKTIEDYELDRINVPFPVLCQMHCSLKDCSLFMTTEDNVCRLFKFPTDSDAIAKIDIQAGQDKPAYVEASLYEDVVARVESTTTTTTTTLTTTPTTAVATVATVAATQPQNQGN